MSDRENSTTEPDALALWRSLGRLARLASEPCEPPSVLSYLNDAWIDGWRQEDAKQENQHGK
jgi:hypothetical protein